MDCIWTVYGLYTDGIWAAYGLYIKAEMVLYQGGNGVVSWRNERHPSSQPTIMTFN
jgi:hypothetical protein